METQRLCRECGEPLIGRSDKKFCSDQCRNNYNNRRYSQEEAIVRSINQVLKKNYYILKDANPSGKTTIPRHKLLEKGFNFSYFTSQYTTRSGKTYHYVYDEGYLPLENDLMMLVKKNNTNVS